MNIFKKLKLLKEYKKTIKKNKDVFLKDYKLKIDSIGRCYTIVEIPKDIMETRDIYGVESEGIVYNYIFDELKTINEKFKELGLQELIWLSSASKETGNYYRIIIEFKFLNLKKYFKVKMSIYAILLSIITFLVFNFIIF